MPTQTNATATRIGDFIFQARRDAGFKSRASLVESSRLKGRVTQEWLRKIEAGERVPKLENLRLLGEALGLGIRKIKQLEKMALGEQVKRVTRRAGNVAATIQIEGVPIHVERLPPKKKAEAFARKSTEEIMALAERLGWFKIPEDREWFRRHSRQVLLRNISPHLEAEEE